MAFDYKIATLEDIDLLVFTRLRTLRAANKLSPDFDLSFLEESTRKFYINSLSNHTHIAYLVFDDNELIGTGGITFFCNLPTYHDSHTGDNAVIMNMYTAPMYRGKGIAKKTLQLLLDIAVEHGISNITLDATDMGKPLYEKFGFTTVDSAMARICTI